MQPSYRAAMAAIAAAIGFGLSAPAQAIGGDPAIGRSKANACTVCHGPMGLSSNPGAPHLAGQPAAYLVEQMRDYRSGKRVNPIMTVIAKPLSDQDILDLSAWYASIEIQLKP
jgi:cytochrome c553